LSLLAKIGFFALFLAEYGVYRYATTKYAERLTRPLSTRAQFLFSFVPPLLFLLHIVASLYLLARQFSFVFLAVLSATYGVSTIIALLLAAFRGSGFYRGFIFGREIGGKYPSATKGVAAATNVIGVVVYPVVIGVAYFTHHVPSERLTFWVIAANALLVLISVLVLGTLAILMLSSPLLDDEMRSTTFYQQLVSVLVPALWLAILYWASGFSEATTRFHVQGLLVTPSVPLLAFLIGFIVLTALGPYVVGARRARAQRLDFLGTERAWMTRLMEATEIPTCPSYAQRLRDIQAEVTEERDEFINKNALFFGFADDDRSAQPPEPKSLAARPEISDGEFLGAAIQSPVPEVPAPPFAPAPAVTGIEATLREQISKMQDTDTRFRYRHVLERVSTVTDELLREAQTAAERTGAADGKLHLADSWATIARERRAEAVAELDAVRRRRLPLGAGSAFVATSVMGVLLDQFGKWIWSSIPGLS
jgi:hypothetical protein